MRLEAVQSQLKTADFHKNSMVFPGNLRKCPIFRLFLPVFVLWQGRSMPHSDRERGQ
jgi:hypothetical protein